MTLQDKKLRDTITYLMDAYRRQARVPNENILTWLDEERSKVHRVVFSMQPKIRSVQARTASTEVLRKLNSLAMDARLKLYNRNIARARRLATPVKATARKQKSPTKPIRPVKKAKATAKTVRPKPWR